MLPSLWLNVKRFRKCSFVLGPVLNLLVPRTVVPQYGWFCPPWGIWQSLETLSIVTAGEEGAIGIKWVETRDAAKQPTKHRTAPTTQNYPAPNVDRG